MSYKLTLNLLLSITFKIGRSSCNKQLNEYFQILPLNFYYTTYKKENCNLRKEQVTQRNREIENYPSDSSQALIPKYLIPNLEKTPEQLQICTQIPNIKKKKEKKSDIPKEP